MLKGTVRKAECITQDEEVVWSKGLLGDHFPKALLNTMFYINGSYFTYAQGKNIRHFPCQIQTEEREGEIPYLQCTENASKNKQGGLRGRMTTPSLVKKPGKINNISYIFSPDFMGFYKMLNPMKSYDHKITPNHNYKIL